MPKTKRANTQKLHYLINSSGESRLYKTSQLFFCVYEHVWFFEDGKGKVIEIKDSLFCREETCESFEECRKAIIYNNRFHLGIRLPATWNKIKNCVEFLNKIESFVELREKTKYYAVHDFKGKEVANLYAIEASTAWQTSRSALSLYLLLIRIGLSHRLRKPFDDLLQDKTRELINCTDSDRLGNILKVLPHLKHQAFKDIFQTKWQGGNHEGFDDWMEYHFKDKSPPQKSKVTKKSRRRVTKRTKSTKK